MQVSNRVTTPGLNLFGPGQNRSEKLPQEVKFGLRFEQ